MKINEINISRYGATLLDKKISNHEVIVINDWLDGAAAPVFHREYNKYKDVILTVLFQGTDEKRIIKNIDSFLAEIKTSTLKFNDLSFYYDVKFIGKIEPEKLNNKNYKVRFFLLGYKTYEEEHKKTILTDRGNIFNPGTLESPVWIEIKPTNDIETFVIDGLTKKPIVLKNLVGGAVYVVDGYTMRFLKNGANDIKNFEGFEFPKLQPEDNNVLFSVATEVNVKFFPYYH